MSEICGRTQTARVFDAPRSSSTYTVMSHSCRISGTVNVKMPSKITHAGDSTCSVDDRRVCVVKSYLGTSTARPACEQKGNTLRRAWRC